ncbi:putative holin-like toxin, partial [Staphylococcus aureus]
MFIVTFIGIVVAIINLS